MAIDSAGQELLGGMPATAAAPPKRKAKGRRRRRVVRARATSTVEHTSPPKAKATAIEREAEPICKALTELIAIKDRQKRGLEKVLGEVRALHGVA